MGSKVRHSGGVRVAGGVGRPGDYRIETASQTLWQDPRKSAPFLPLAKDFEHKIEQLNQGDSDRHVNRDLQPSAGLLGAAQQIAHLVRGVVQRIRELLEVLGRSPQTLEHSR